MDYQLLCMSQSPSLGHTLPLPSVVGKPWKMPYSRYLQSRTMVQWGVELWVAVFCQLRHTLAYCHCLSSSYLVLWKAWPCFFLSVFLFLVSFPHLPSTPPPPLPPHILLNQEDRVETAVLLAVDRQGVSDGDSDSDIDSKSNGESEDENTVITPKLDNPGYELVTDDEVLEL